MTHDLTRTARNMANAIAVEKAKLGEGARVIGQRQKSMGKLDLAYIVEAPNGNCKEVIVTHAALKRRMDALSSDNP